MRGSVTVSDGDAPVAVTSEAVPALAVEVGEYRLALPLEVVREVHRIVAFTPAPAHDAAVVGLVSVRGVVLPVVDLGVLMGVGPVAQRLETPMVLCATGEGSVCLLVDAVSDLLDVPLADVHRPGGAAAVGDGVLGAWSSPDGPTLLLDAGHLVDRALSLCGQPADRSAGRTTGDRRVSRGGERS